jgi:hypothetical protein
MASLFSRGENRLFLDRNNGRALETKLVQGSVATVVSPATIEPLSSSLLMISPLDFLSNDTSDVVLIRGVLGGLARTAEGYRFTPTPLLSTSLQIISGTKVFPGQSREQDEFYIGPVSLKGDSTGLLVGAKAIVLKSFFGLIGTDRLSGWAFMVRDKLNQVGFGLRAGGSFYVRGLEIGSTLKTKEVQNKFSGFYISFKDRLGQIVAGVKTSGAVFVNRLSTNSFQLAAFKAEEKQDSSRKSIVLRDKLSKVLYSLETSGTHSFPEIKARSYVDNGSLDFIKPTFNLSNFLSYLSSNQVNTRILTGSGQSNSVGADGFLDSTSSAFNGYLDTTQSYTGNVKLLDSGSAPLYDGTGDILSLVPLVEPMKPVRSLPNEPGYPGNIYGQSHASPIANEMSAKMPGWRAAFGLFGESGAALARIKKGGTGNSWAKMLYEVNAIKTLLVASGKTYTIGAHFFTHGEADWADVNYGTNLIQYAKDLQDDLLPISGQKEPIPMILSQQGTFPFDYYNDGLISAQKQFEAARDSPLIYLAGPLYHRRYTTQQDVGSGVHRTAWDFRAEGIKYAQVAIAVACGIDWKPLQPNRIIQVDNNHIRVRFDVPSGPLRFDPNITQPQKFYNLNADPAPVPNPWASGRGFEVYGDGYNWDYQNNFIPISDCYLISKNEVEITIPSGSKPAFIAYAWMIFRPGGDLIPNPYAADYGIVTPGGRGRGRRGSLCDSDPWRGYDELKLNCGVTAGSNTITVTGNAFKPVGWYFRVAGASFSGKSPIVTGRVSDNQLTLSEPWTGPTGTVPLIFWSDQSNYCIHFKLPINYSS